MEWKISTCRCSGGNGMPMERITDWGRGFLHSDHLNTSIKLLFPLLLLLSLSTPFTSISFPAAAFTIFSPLKQSSYLHKNQNNLEVDAPIWINQIYDNTRNHDMTMFLLLFFSQVNSQPACTAFQVQNFTLFQSCRGKQRLLQTFVRNRTYTILNPL